MTLVSIIITNFNREDYLDRAIRSCFEQSTSRDIDIEVIVVDDASTDNSLRKLSMFKKSIKLIKHKTNLGVAVASNSGIKSSKGDFIVRLDADDFMNKYSVQILAQVLIENQEYGFAYSDHFRVDEKGFKEKKITLDDEEKLFEHGAGVMFRKNIFKEIGFYNEKLKNCEDYDFLLRVKKKYLGFRVPIPLYRYFIHGNNISLKEDRDKYRKIVRKDHGI